jgi:hypothetical protein
VGAAEDVEVVLCAAAKAARAVTRRKRMLNRSSGELQKDVLYWWVMWSRDNWIGEDVWEKKMYDEKRTGNLRWLVFMSWLTYFVAVLFSWEDYEA